jgi:creatinine amidohydrolase
MIAAMTDWTESFLRHGFERIYWFNGHGGNISTIEAAFSEIHARRSFDPRGADNRPGLVLKRRDWWDFREVMNLCNQLYPSGHGSHATASEVSVTYWAYPDRERQHTVMSPKIAPNGTISDAVRYRRDFPDGRIGSDPTQSNAADGGRIVDVAAKCLIEEVARFAA